MSFAPSTNSSTPTPGCHHHRFDHSLCYRNRTPNSSSRAVHGCTPLALQGSKIGVKSLAALRKERCLIDLIVSDATKLEAETNEHKIIIKDSSALSVLSHHSCWSQLCSLLGFCPCYEGIMDNCGGSPSGSFQTARLTPRPPPSTCQQVELESQDLAMH